MDDAMRKSWTPEDVREKLGFQDASLFSNQQIHRNLANPNYFMAECGRRTGRTTEMLLKVVADVLNGKVVYVLGHSYSASAHHCRRARGLIWRLGESTKFEVRDQKSWMRARRTGLFPREFSVYTDHLVNGVP